MEQAYFVTVDWCGKGKRGIFCSRDGSCFRKEGKPHTEEEMYEVLGVFDLILAPKSEVFTKKQVEEFSRWIPLDEYSGQYGIALKAQSCQQN